MIKLPKNFNDFEIYIDNPFTIFEKKNIFSENIYNQLYEEFPNENYFDSKHSLGLKKYFNNKSKNFYDFINSSDVWLNFYNYLNSETFSHSIFNLCQKNILYIGERKKIRKISFKNKIKNNVISRVLRKLKKFLGIYEIRIGFEFSILKNGAFIPPHNDTENKLISLMFYFPDENQNEKNELGTNFYKIKSNEGEMNLWKGDMLDDEKSKDFFKSHEVFHNSKFERNKIVGFIKSKFSWHDVSVIDDNFKSRKSININLYII